MAAYTVSTGWTPIDRIGLNQAINAISTTKTYELGERVTCKDMSSSAYGFGEFIYLLGVGSTIAGSVVLIKDDYSTSLIAARDKGAIGVACAANVASSYGWYQIKGKAMASCAAAVNANVPMFIAAANVIDDAVVAGDQIHGMRSVTGVDTATLIVNMGVNPHAGDTDNA
jgi:hypothetical protein